MLNLTLSLRIRYYHQFFTGKGRDKFIGEKIENNYLTLRERVKFNINFYRRNRVKFLLGMKVYDPFLPCKQLLVAITLL